MLTDLEKLKALFDEFGIGYSVDGGASLEKLSLEASCHSGVLGYSGFICDFVFQNGEFDYVDIYE